MSKKVKSEELLIADKELAFQIAEKKRLAEVLVIADVEKTNLEAELVIAEKEKAKREVELAIAEKEKAKRAAELVIANIEKAKRADELVIANQEKAKRADELIIANAEKAKHAAELVIANIEKAKRADELINADKELTYQNEEKVKRAAELVIADVIKAKREAELVIANIEKAKRIAKSIIADKELSFQTEEKSKRAAELVIADAEKAKREDELIIANKELVFQNREKEKRADELIIANKELAFQNEEKAKRADELIIANKELAFQNDEKAKRADELIIANKELVFQNREKEKRADELSIANKELAFQNEEKEKRADELIIANKELAFQNEEKEKRADELIIANKELEQLLQLNADKDRFISILAHDLRSPFTVLLGLSEFLIENIREYDTDEIENHLKLIKNSAQDTFALLEDLLKWIRAQSGNIPFKPQNLSFADICNDILKTLNPNADIKNISINYSKVDHLTVFADADMLKTVLRNLASNAIKFTNNGGTISINAIENSSNVTISVSDNGIGISPENLIKLFDISQVLSTKGTAKETGTGLGLLLCKEFVEKHGGKIWVESECGKGSIFYFNIPYNAESKEKNVLLTNSEDNQIKNLKILIVDDNELLRIILYEMVKKFGKEFLYAKTGIEAVAACHDNPDIDLILMDYLMPEMDGHEATRQIRLFNKEVVIIVQTAYVLSNENEMAIEAGCNDCISKPINKTLLYELIKKHCNK